MTELSPAALRELIADENARFHFVGLGGSGMSALAQYRALAGGATSGSDRTFDRGLQTVDRDRLAAAGISIAPQDGSAIEGAALVIASTAVEADIPDLAKARELGVPTIHRAELLAAHAAGPSVAIAGTSGKSTVTAMVYEILVKAGRDPGLITGGRLIRLIEAGRGLGNAAGGAGPLVFEADESDGSLVRHQPSTAVLLNLHRDHMEPAETLKLFRTLRARTRGPFVISDDEAIAELRAGSLVFGFGPHAKVRGANLDVAAAASTFTVAGTRIHVPMPGEHNARNALAAFATGRALGVDEETAAAALAEYRGVHRRLETVGEAHGVLVIDDFAHNPDKIRASLRAARGRGNRVLAFFQPHGYAPARFFRDHLIAMLEQELKKRDRFWLGEIYYAGGTAAEDIKSGDIVDLMRNRGVAAELASDRDALAATIAAEAQEGDVVLLMGARDTTLPDFSRRVFAAIRDRA